MNFLVVDDSRMARRRVIDYIEELEMKVIGEAVDGLEAISQFKLLSPDIITLDLEMPNMKGIASAKEILKLDSNVNIILVTSIIDKKELINALKIGVKKVLIKPFTQETFKRTIEELNLNEIEEVQ